MKLIAINENGTIAKANIALLEKNVSNSILSKLGFIFKGEFAHFEDGKVWEWHLQ